MAEHPPSSLPPPAPLPALPPPRRRRWLNYRETVLEAFQEVENNLAAVHWLAEAGKVQQEAARESVVLTVNQYKAGTVSYFNVVQVQATQLSEERATVNLLGRRLATTVALIRAMGGDWGEGRLP